MTRLILTLVVAVVLAGMGAIFVWSTLNAIFKGDAGWLRIGAALLVIAAMFALLGVVIRVVRQLE